MLKTGEPAPAFTLPTLTGAERSFAATPGGKPTLLAFFETDCPTCGLTFPYLNRLAQTLGEAAAVLGIAQDDVLSTRAFAERLRINFPILLDQDLKISRQYDPLAVPTLFLLDSAGKITRTVTAFDKSELNELTADLCRLLNREPFTLAEKYDGAPATKPGCTSRHLEPAADNAPGFSVAEPATDNGLASDSPTPHSSYKSPNSHTTTATRLELGAEVDDAEYCLTHNFDPLPVIPPTVERVERMLRATALALIHNSHNSHNSPSQSQDVIALVPPNYGQATLEKIAANAVMAGCQPEMLRVLIPLLRAACDERFNLHGVQATTHFAAPLIIVNGPVRHELGFACGSNVFSNVARANSTLGRALQLILTNIGGARPGEIDMSALGNPGKFSYCIAENEEENPWEPLHVEQGFAREQSTVTLFAAEPPRGVSEHNARTGRTVLKALTRALATIWSYRACALFEAFVVLCPEHVKTLHRDGFTKQTARAFLFENTGIPLRAYEDGEGEGTQMTKFYEQVTIDGEPCYRKFSRPEQLKLIVAGGTAGKFSAVIGSWATGPRGSQIVTYPI